MTHLSDTSYLDRLVANVFLFPLMLYYVLLIKQGYLDVRGRLPSNGKFLRFVIFSFYVVAYVTILAYDVLATQLKYEEGFVDTCLMKKVNGTGTAQVHRYPKHAFLEEETSHHTFYYDGPKDITASWTSKGNCGIKQTPSSLYSEKNLELLSTIDLLFNLTCTLRNSGLFLLLAWFNSSVHAVFQKTRLTALGDPLTSTISTQFLWSVELYIAALLLFITNHRVSALLRKRRNASFNASLKSHTSESSTVDVVDRSLQYALYANAALAFVCIGQSTGLLILNIDIVMMTDGRVIYGSKLLTDIWTRVFNFFFVLEPVLSILILYKPNAIIIPSRVAFELTENNRDGEESQSGKSNICTKASLTKTFNDALCSTDSTSVSLRVSTEEEKSHTAKIHREEQGSVQDSSSSTNLVMC